MSDQSMTLEAGLHVDDLVHRTVQAARLRDCGSRALAFYLWELQSRRLCQRLGYPDAVRFAANELDIGLRRAQELVAAGRRLLELKVVDAAFRDGHISWSKARVLLRVATVETEASWVGKAMAVSCHELGRLARQALPGEEPGDGAGGLPAVRFRVEAELDALAYEEWTQARRKLQAELGTELGEADALRRMAQMVLATREDGTVQGRTPIDESIYKVVVDPERAHVRADDGPEDVSPAAVAAAASDGAVSAALRRRVLARDGHRCRRCGRKGALQVHHVVWRAHGGRTVAENLVSLCAHCHALVHEGLLTAEGTGDGLRFRAGTAVPRAHLRAIELSVPGRPPMPAVEAGRTLESAPRRPSIPAAEVERTPESAPWRPSIPVAEAGRTLESFSRRPSVPVAEAGRTLDSVPRRPSIPVAEARRARESIPTRPPIRDAEPELTLDSIPRVVTRQWWIEHEHLFEDGPRGTIRLKSPRAQARARTMRDTA